MKRMDTTVFTTRKPTPIIILGTGGNSVDILDTINEINARSSSDRYQCLGFLDDNDQMWGTRVAGLEVLGPLDHASRFPDAYFVNGIGSDRTFWRKEEIIARTGVPRDRFATIVHPSASVSRMSSLGAGTVILQQVTVASNVTIGDHVIVLPNSILSHDSIVGDYTSIAGGVCVSGNVRIGRSCYLGSNSVIIEKRTIGDYALVGLGSVVLHDVPANTVVVGNPARFLRKTRPTLQAR